jgi:fimbrial chaperone protein
MERSYRVFVEELPPERRPGAESTSVSVLTKMGIPVFLVPSTPHAQMALRDLTAVGSTLSFRIVNSGTVHLVPEMVRVVGTGQAGDIAFEHTLQSWYVLAGGERTFAVAVPVPECSRLRSLAIEVQAAGTAVKERLETPRGACAP